MSDSPDELDRLLQQWATRNEPSKERMTRLRTWLSEAAAPAALVTLKDTRWPHWTSASLGALSAVVAMSLLLVFWPSGQDVPDPPSSAPESVAAVPETHLRSLLVEMERMFDDRLAWVVETNEEVSLGIDSTSAPGASHSNDRIAVRVVVLKREAANAPWRAVWKGDVATRPEELVSVSSESSPTSLALWTHVLPDGAVSVEMELAGLGSDAKAWQTNNVQQPHVPTSVLLTRQGDVEFQVWQTAAVFQEKTL